MDDHAFDLPDADLSLLSLFAGWALADELQGRLAADGFADLRFADGFVFQQLVPGPATVGALAAAAGVSQQAASKAVADLERRGYVSREADPDDRRARRVALTARGEAAVAAGRRHRAALDEELARRLLADTVAALGGGERVRARRVRPPR